MDTIDLVRSGQEYLTFRLGAEHYGVDILSVKEIRGWTIPTLIPNSPRYVLGVINIRGIIIPVIDLRLKFAVGEASYSDSTVIIVLSQKNKSGERMMGFVVDAASDVRHANPGDIQTSAVLGGFLPPEMIRGMLNVENDVVTLLMTKQLLTLENDENDC